MYSIEVLYNKFCKKIEKYKIKYDFYKNDKDFSQITNKNIKKYKYKLNDMLLGKNIIDKQNDIINSLNKTINDLNEEIEMRKNLEIQLEDELNKKMVHDYFKSEHNIILPKDTKIIFGSGTSMTVIALYYALQKKLKKHIKVKTNTDIFYILHEKLAKLLKNVDWVYSFEH